MATSAYAPGASGVAGSAAQGGISGFAAGGLIGAGVGLVGGIVQGLDAKRAEERFKKQFRRGVEQGRLTARRETYDVLNSPEYKAAQNFALGLYGSAPEAAGGFAVSRLGGQAYGSAPVPADQIDPRGAALARQISNYMKLQQVADAGVSPTGERLSEGQVAALQAKLSAVDIGAKIAAVEQLGGSARTSFVRGLERSGTDLSRFNDLYGSVTGKPVGGSSEIDPLTKNFVAGITQAQASRGIFSGRAPAITEASGLAAFRTNLQAQLLPTLQNLATFGSDTLHKYEAANISREVQYNTGGLGVYGTQNAAAAPQPSVGSSALSGLISGFGSGAQVGLEYDYGKDIAAYRDSRKTGSIYTR